mgnify:CR=1 FL=1
MKYLSDYYLQWYKSNMDEQLKRINELSTNLTLNQVGGYSASAELLKAMPSKMDLLMSIPTQKELIADLVKAPTLPEINIGSPTSLKLEEFRGSVLAALSPNIGTLSTEIYKLGFKYPETRSVVARAIELSETQDDTDDSPTAIEEFVEANPEVARSISEELLHIILETTGKPKDWWDGLSLQDRCRVVYECGRYMFNSAISAVTMGGGLVTGTYLAGQLVFSLVAIVFISADAKNGKDS